ncbi:hypothetical protein L6452_00581 [Arctium lappa]|uniref:Uncharacterized protein n=1 Tax=Arctium lappa TaxID=4217 RepID=A0ACB9FDR3_ARCLA|nr:hypothetical protein L6452_00581 [Arctium lappa]
MWITQFSRLSKKHKYIGKGSRGDVTIVPTLVINNRQYRKTSSSEGHLLRIRGDVLAQVARGIANFAKCELRAQLKVGIKSGKSHLIEDGALPWIVKNANNEASPIRRHIELALCHMAQHAIFQLPKLEFLSVASNNKLTGSFPEFRSDSLLEHLDLASTGFFGIVPESISNLHRLTFLRLDKCYFSGNIPRSLSNMTQLVGLSLAQNDFTGVVPSLVSLSKLNLLELSGNRFEKGRLPDWLGKLTKLNELYLCQMNLYGEIPSFLSNLTKLRVIGLENNSFFGHIPSSFMNMTHLRMITLGANQLQGPIPSSFSNLKFLRHLFLY